MTTETSGRMKEALLPPNGGGEEGAIRHRASLLQQTGEHVEDAMAGLCVPGALGMEENLHDRDMGGYCQERPPPQPQPRPGRNITRWCAARGTKPTHYL